MQRIYALDAMNTGQAAVTWLSTVGFKSHQGDHFCIQNRRFPSHSA
jgi:hypothetical protein